MTRVLHLLLLTIGSTVLQVGHAQEPPPEPSRFRDPEDGKFDVSSFLEKPRGFLPVPVVITEPAVGYGGGLVGMFLRPRKQAGEQGWARPNISALGAIGTENGTRAAFAGDASRWLDGRLKTLAALGAAHINLDFYGLGANSASLDEAIRYTLDTRLMFLQGTWQLKPKSPWSLGLRYIYAQVEPKLRDEPVIPGLADHVDVEISAPAAVLEFDSRDNVFTPTRGIFAETVYLMSREDLGANVDFERFQQVVMGWYPITDAVTLGMRADYQRASDDAPFFLRPYIELRGVQAMRYQGDEMASAEIEARWRFRDRWSAVVAVGAGTAHSDGENFSATQDIVSGAVGVRYELARKFGLHAGLDIGFSSETTAIYFQVGNAWFRP
ncbi:MAG TPA: hypothetical protein VJT80_02475 [Steroidobacteraceae bacterium]|nr:hypothetical protein [Steroidobacteraceae bacterium]